MGILRKHRGKLSFVPEGDAERSAFAQLGEAGISVSIGDKSKKRKRKKAKLDESKTLADLDGTAAAEQPATPPDGWYASPEEAEAALKRELEEQGASPESEPDRRATADEHGKGHPPQTETDALRAPEAGEQEQSEKVGENAFEVLGEAPQQSKPVVDGSAFDHDGDGKVGGSKKREVNETTQPEVNSLTDVNLSR